MRCVAALAALIASATACKAAAAAEIQQSLPEITVEARRRAIGPEVRQFVDQFVYLENDETPPLWRTPVCPAVSGLKHDEAEFILARMSEVARRVGVPLGGERCTPPNLLIIATATPADFLQQWGKREKWRMYHGNVMPHEIHRFIDTPEPARVWSNIEQGSARFAQRAPGAPTAALANSAANSIGGPLTTVPAFAGASATRLTYNAIWSTTSAFVVIDTRQAAGVTISQLSDYIALRVLGHLKSRSFHGNAPTILSVFDAGESDRPPGLTPWDEAFLTALYHTDPSSVLQRSQITDRMIRELVPDGTR